MFCEKAAKKILRNSKGNLESTVRLFLKCDALHDLVPFTQFKKREKHP